MKTRSDTKKLTGKVTANSEVEGENKVQNFKSFFARSVYGKVFAFGVFFLHRPRSFVTWGRLYEAWIAYPADKS